MNDVMTVTAWYRHGHFVSEEEARGAFKLAHQQALDGLGKSQAEWLGMTDAEFDAWMGDELPPMHPLGTVYFLQIGTSGPIKIGCSKDVPRRVRELQCAHYDALRLIGTKPGGFAEEARLHAKLGEYCIRGEWFHPHRDVFREVPSA